MNIGDPWPDLFEAESEVLTMQTKLHRWATEDPGRRFDDLYNLVYDPAFLVVAWNRVRGNKGARTAGVDGVSPRSVVFGAGELLDGIRDDLKSRRFAPVRVREKAIPKASGKIRRLGIPTATDRVVQASLKLVLEPIFEADFKPCSYGFRPKRRAQDAIAEIHYLASPNRNYEWVFEADITACFDEIDHAALMGRVRRRIGDKRILGLVKAFLRAGILSEDSSPRETITGTPQGGILSPLLANIALSVLDEHFVSKYEALGPEWTRSKHRRSGGSVMRLVRYADDFVVMVAGTRDDAEALWGEVGRRARSDGLASIGRKDEGLPHRRGVRLPRLAHPASGLAESLRETSRLHLSVEEGLGLRHGQGAEAHPTQASSDTCDLLRQLNPVLRGWCNYFRHGVSSRTFGYLDHFAFWRVVGWVRKRHAGLNMGTLVRRFLPGWQIRAGRFELFRPEAVAIIRYRYRGTRIPTPWTSGDPGGTAPAA